MRILYSVLSIVAFYLFYWIGRSILFSFIDDTWTLENIVIGEWSLAAFIGFMICLFVDIILDSEDWAACAFIIMCITFIATKLPYSVGLAILYNIVVLGNILYTIWTCRKYQYE